MDDDGTCDLKDVVVAGFVVVAAGGSILRQCRQSRSLRFLLSLGSTDEAVGHATMLTRRRTQ